MLPKICGVYLIRCTKGSKAVYVGQAQNCRVRFNHHKHHLKSGSHRNPRLQNAWLKYGEDAFVFEVIEVCSPQDLTLREQFYLTAHITSGAEVFNASEIADCPARGRKFGPMSDEQKEKIALALRGRERSPEHRANLSLSQRGKKISDEARAKMRDAKLGKKQSQEHVANAAAARLGRPHPVSPEARDRLIERNKSARSKETIEKLRDSATGRKLSAEAKLKCSAAAKMYWSSRKQEVL
jgi:group I intron endonuclease